MINFQFYFPDNIHSSRSISLPSGSIEQLMHLKGGLVGAVGTVGPHLGVHSPTGRNDLFKGISITI